MKNGSDFDSDLFRERLKKRCKEKWLTYSQLAEKAGLSPSLVNKWLNGDIDAYGAKVRTVPSLEKLLAVARVLEVSLDYFVNPDMECETVSNQAIFDRLGLDDKAIKALENIKQSDTNAIHNEQPLLCVLPVLCDMLGYMDGVYFEGLLRAFRDFLHTDYHIPVFHTGNKVVRESETFGKVLDNETIVSPSGLDVIKGSSHTFVDKKGKEKTVTTPPVYLQHFARENNLYDNIPVPITRSFMQAVALKQIEGALYEIKNGLQE